MNKKPDKSDSEELVDQVMERLRPKVHKALEKDGLSLYDIEIDIDNISQGIKKAGKDYSATRDRKPNEDVTCISWNWTSPNIPITRSSCSTSASPPTCTPGPTCSRP